MAKTTNRSQPAPRIRPLKCPTCGHLVKATHEDFPFCSDRCRKIDLGKWAMGVYRISSPALDPELSEALESGGGSLIADNEDE